MAAGSTCLKIGGPINPTLFNVLRSHCFKLCEQVLNSTSTDPFHGPATVIGRQSDH